MINGIRLLARGGSAEVNINRKMGDRMRLIDADELIEHVWRDRLDSRERIANLVKSMPSAEPPTSLYTDGFKDGYRQGFKDAQERKEE